MTKRRTSLRMQRRGSRLLIHGFVFGVHGIKRSLEIETAPRVQYALT